MKKEFLISLLSLLLLTSCGNYYDKTDSVYPLGFGNSTNRIVAINVDANKTIMPFDTSIYLTRYQQNSNFKDISELLNNTYQTLHAFFDSNYFYRINGERINNLKSINNSYGTNEYLEVPFELYDVLEKAQELTILTEGKFNVAIGELATLWNNYIINSKDNFSANKPSEEEISKALKNTPKYDEIEKLLSFKKENNKYYIRLNVLENYEKISLSLGAIGKGYANDIMEKKLPENVQGYLNSGESLITLLSPSIGETWNLRLTNPLYSKKMKMDEDFSNYNPSEVLIKKHEKFSISTSGDYERFFYDEEKNIYHHIINPLTGYPSGMQASGEYFTAVSAICSTGTYADVITTALMNMSIEEGKKVIKTLEDKYGIFIHPLWLKQVEDKIILYADENLKNQIFIDGGVNSQELKTTLEFINLNH